MINKILLKTGTLTSNPKIMALKMKPEDQDDEIKQSLKKIKFTKKDLDNINFDLCIYFQSDGKNTHFFLDDDVSALVCASLTTVLNKASGYLFFRCHKSFAVNLEFVRGVKHDKDRFPVVVLASGGTIPCSFRCKTSLLKAYQNYILEKSYIRYAHKNRILKKEEEDNK